VPDQHISEENSMNIKRNAALAGMLVLAAACGGGNDAANTDTAPATTETAAPAPAPAAETTAAAPATTGATHEVQVNTTQNGASGEFAPASITVHKGDVIHFVSSGAAMHNVSFPASENAGKTGLPADSPYLNDGQSYDLTVTMDPGTYTYVCVPHQAMGMKGTIVVE
jgi:plastocyanin